MSARPGANGSILPLHLEGVEFVAGGHVVLSGIGTTIDRDARTVILGPNGAGKSVLMRICHGLLAPTSGTVRWARRDEPALRRRQGMVFQRPVMLRRSALENVAYGLKLARVPAEERLERARAALERVGLAHLAQRPARVLSGGEQQRVALARVWALEPEVLFLDEPTSNLDPGATAAIERAINAIRDSGAKIIMTTHNLGQARRHADEILFLHEGRLVERSPADRFFRHPASREADAFLKGELPWV